MKKLLKAIILIPLAIVLSLAIGITAHFKLYNKSEEVPMAPETISTPAQTGTENADPNKYHVTLDSGLLVFEKDQEYYEEGEEVVIIMEEMATDTDYTFYINGEYIQPRWENNGFVLRFPMPAEDVIVSLTSENTMEYNGDSWAEE